MSTNVRVFGGLDTSDATATAAQIRRGYSAYGSAGAKLDGTFDGVDTSDATATAAQILSGYIAYAQGQRIVGNLVVSPTIYVSVCYVGMQGSREVAGSNGYSVSGSTISSTTSFLSYSTFSGTVYTGCRCTTSRNCFAYSLQMPLNGGTAFTATGLTKYNANSTIIRFERYGLNLWAVFAVAL